MFEHQYLQIITNMGNFHPLEVVGRGSETQLQVGEGFFYCSALGVKNYIYTVILYQQGHSRGCKFA